MTGALPSTALGLDFGTTNSVVALSSGSDHSGLVAFGVEGAAGEIFRSALCFWEDEGGWQGVASEAGPWAIGEYLQSPADSRFIQSFKSVAASPLFDSARIYGRTFRFEDLGRIFLQKLRAHAGDQLKELPDRIIVGRPVEFAGSRPNPELARERYDLMLDQWGKEVLYVHEPLGAAFSYASRLDEPATVLVADFGGGTTDFSVVSIGEPGKARRCRPLAATGIGIAGDRFDKRIMEHVVLPLLGKGGSYRSFGKILDIPGGYFNDFGDWSRLALMRNRRTIDELRKLQRAALEPAPISRMITLIESEQGFPLYEAVGRAKRDLSTADETTFVFEHGDVQISTSVTRVDFERWIANDLQRIEVAMHTALAAAEIAASQIDRIFLTGGSSLIPTIRNMFVRLFGENRIASGGELTSIAHGLALIGAEQDPRQWSA